MRTKISPQTKAVYNEIRKIFPKFIEDAPKYKDLERIKTYFEESDPIVSSRTKMKATNGAVAS